MSVPQTPDDHIWQICDEARALYQALRRGESDACERIRRHVPHLADAADAALFSGSGVNLRDVVSREHGFTGFEVACERLRGYRFLRGDASLEHLKKQARRLLKAYRDGDPETVERVRAHWHRDAFTLNEALFVLAREHGFDSWPKLVAKLETPEGVVEMSRPQLLVLEEVHDPACAAIGRLFSEQLGAEAWCDTTFVDQTTYAEVIAVLSQPGCLCTLAVEAMASRALVDIAMPLVEAILDRGANARSQPLTPAEQDRMRPVFAAIVNELQRAFRPRLSTAFGDVTLHTDPSHAQVTAPESLVVLIGYQVCTPEIHGLVPIVYPVPQGLFDLRQHFQRH